MARKKKSPIEELSRKNLVDGRYKDPQDPRAQKRATDKISKRLRDQ